MHFLRRNLKRIATDVAGYGLILLGIVLSPVPGPGGIPLIIAGLGLLSINNEWARRLRGYLLIHGGKVVKVLFPPNAFAQVFYDVLTLTLFGLVAWLVWNHSHTWQISIAVALFFIALFVAAMNRDRYNRLKHKH